MKVACYADDAKEPELIGECVVGIDDVLKQGEVDEWYTFTHKDKYSGEIYLELTFYSNVSISSLSERQADCRMLRPSSATSLGLQSRCQVHGILLPPPRPLCRP